MVITPLAAESLGVRSSAVFIETADVNVLIDPGVSLAPLRHGLTPHPLEIRRMNERWRIIKEYANRADILIITHYHFDHFDPTEPLVFNNKLLLVKHPTEHINASQIQRAKDLRKNYRTLPRRVEFADNNRFAFGGTVIQFSPAVPHGPTTTVGWVVQVSIREGDSCFLATSDIQGASLPEHLEFICAENPDTLLLDGPISYMQGEGFGTGALRASVRNLCTLLETTRVATLILDHHLLRDPNWKEKMGEVFATAAKTGRKIVTAAGYLGKKDEQLEAKRQQLYVTYADMPAEPVVRSENFSLCKKLSSQQGGT
jgi:predicted metallo-beta-lactamase superfamily hydrolase